MGISGRAEQAQTAPAAPQQTAPAPSGEEGKYTFHVNSRLVVLDVVVTDQQGHIVNNLTKDDFKVYEDKVLQPIRSFDHTQPKPAAEILPINSTSELDRKEPNAPVSIIVLDEINTKFMDEAFTRYSLKKYLATQGDTLLQPTMLVAVNLEHFMVLRDYTTSKAEILNAVAHHLQENPWKSEGGSFKAEQYDAAFSSLIEVAQATAGHPGHKNIIWVGKGIPSIDPTTLIPDSAEALKAMIAQCTNMLRDSRVTLYTIDPAGVPTEDPSQDADGFNMDDPFGGEVDFDELASTTGGKSFFGRNDIDAGIDASVQAGNNFYTLSYAPTGDASDTKVFRNIQVRLKDPTLTATTRSGYYGITAPVTPAANVAGRSSDRFLFDLTVAADSLMIYDGVPFTIVRDTAQSDSFSIHIEPKYIDWEVGDSQKLSAEIALLAESFDKKGKSLNHKAKVLTAESTSGSQATGLTLHITIPTQSPAARLRFVVRMNHSGKLGTDNFFLVDKKNFNDPSTGLNPTSRK
jgi:VWFA-related protein